MNIETNRIVEALDALMAACGLDKSESATEELFRILMDAFSEGNIIEMMQTILESHREGLCVDMRWTIARAIMKAAGINPFSSN